MRILLNIILVTNPAFVKVGCLVSGWRIFVWELACGKRKLSLYGFGNNCGVGCSYFCRDCQEKEKVKCALIKLW